MYITHTILIWFEICGAERLGATPAQVAIKFCYDEGCITIPKSSNHARIDDVSLVSHRKRCLEKDTEHPYER